jgi:hypothetical protein
MWPFLNGTRKSVVTECAKCGERLFLTEWSKQVDEPRVRCLWQCECCGYSFETTNRIADVAA